MRVLLLLRGSPGCGKSTWINGSGLSSFTLSSDDLRMLYSSPRYDAEGKPYINQSGDAAVWKTLFSILESRMQNGEFTVIDATNSKTSEINRYKNLCDIYKYRMYCVDFTDVPIEVAKDRNRFREPLKIVPDDVIDKCYSRFATQKIPSGVTVIKPDELHKVFMGKNDLSQYKKIHVIGDIYGCFTAYKELIDKLGGYKDDECYVFCGDYLDRGPEVAEMMNELFSLYDKKNVYLLEGNHEWHLWVWACGGVSKSQEFEMRTRTALISAGIEQKSVRKFYRRLGQCAYFGFGGKDYLVTHGGLSTLPLNLTKVSTHEMVLGSGSYKESEIVDESFMANAPDNCVQIHGHRNVKKLPVEINDKCYNLEGGVEFGGHLRAVTLLPDGSVEVHEVKNDVYNKIERYSGNPDDSMDDVGKTVMEFRNNKFISEKTFGNISSFNFTKQAFYDRVWNSQTVRARGLYINVPEQRVVARGYDKFFSISEICNSPKLVCVGDGI